MVNTFKEVSDRLCRLREMSVEFLININVRVCAVLYEFAITFYDSAMMEPLFLL